MRTIGRIRVRPFVKRQLMLIPVVIARLFRFRSTIVKADPASLRNSRFGAYIMMIRAAQRSVEEFYSAALPCGKYFEESKHARGTYNGIHGAVKFINRILSWILL